MLALHAEYLHTTPASPFFLHLYPCIGYNQVLAINTYIYIYILVGLYFAAFTKLICTWYMEIQILTSLVTDMLIYYVPMATEENAQRCQTFSLPDDEVRGLCHMVTLMGVDFRGRGSRKSM